MINNKYDLLKFLIANMDAKTQRFNDTDLKLLNMLGGEKLSEYLTELKTEEFIKVYLNSEILINVKAIEFIRKLYNI